MEGLNLDYVDGMTIEQLLQM
jgi:hypothetical protein